MAKANVSRRWMRPHGTRAIPAPLGSIATIPYGIAEYSDDSDYPGLHSAWVFDQGHFVAYIDQGLLSTQLSRIGGSAREGMVRPGPVLVGAKRLLGDVWGEPQRRDGQLAV